MIESSLRDNYAGVFSARVGFGARPAVLVIDFVRAYTEPSSPFYAAGAAPAAVAASRLVAAAREAGAPVIFTRVAHHASGIDAGRWISKIPAIAQVFIDGPLNEIVPELARGEQELVITKAYPSCFFGTSLAATLVAGGVDTVILAGCSTSGCVRASAVDGLQHGFRVIVPKGCVADRHAAPHEANLFDIDAKYGDVVEDAAAIDYLKALSAR